MGRHEDPDIEPPFIRWTRTQGGDALPQQCDIDAALPAEAYRSVVDTIDDVLFSIDIDGHFRFLNPAWTRLTQRSVSDALGCPILQFVHAADREACRRGLEDLMNGRLDLFQAELRVLNRDGEDCWVELGARAAKREGRFVGASGTLHSIADRRQIEHTLALSELRFRAIFERAAIGIIVALPDGRILSANPAIECMLGYRDRELRGRALHSLVAQDVFDAAKAPLAAMEQGEEEACRTELQFVSKEGELRDVVVHGALIRDADAQPLMVVAMLDDVTERYASEKRLIEAKEEAESIARLKSALLNNISHEVRTPLTTIIGYATILADEVPEEYRDFAHTISRGGQRLLDTLNAVLELARLEADKAQVQLLAVDVNQEIMLVVDLLSPKAADKHLELDVVLPSEPVHVLADPPSLHRVLHNLFSNALKFTEKGGVCIEVKRVDASISIAFRDTGVGISEEFLPHLFDEFEQESTGLGRSHEGSGLGLAISRRLIDLMDGTLKVESRKGEGSTFTVTLPAAEQ